jgi:hypothetical protein
MNTKDRGSRLIFVGGAARSGTTLVQNMLDCHPDILGGPEFLHLQQIIKLRKHLNVSIDKEWIDLYCSKDQLDDHVAVFIESLLMPLADQHGVRYLSEKTPENVLIFPELMEIFPGACFINIIRDPRAVIASMLKVGRRALQKGVRTQNFTHNVRAAIAYIERCYRTAIRAAEIAPQRVLNLSYEQLVTEPEKMTREICRFLNIDWDARMLKPGGKKHLGEKAITVKSDEIWYQKDKYYSNPDAKHIDKWKTVLNPFQQVLICLAFKNHPALTSYGYELSSRHLSFSRRTSAMLLAKGYHALRNVRRKSRECFNLG